MSDDIIRMTVDIPIQCTITEVEYRPKRKQTGWVCRECEGGFCLHGGVKFVKPDYCPIAPEDEDRVWQPFYGKVVE